MEVIEKKIKSFMCAAAGSMIAMIVLGLIFALAPGFTLSVLHWGIALLCIIAGIIMIADDAENGLAFSIFSTSILGIFLVLMGIIIAIYPQTINIVTIAFGVYMIISSIMQLRIAENIKGTSAYVGAVITNVICLLCGIIMIIHPGESNEVIIMIAGISMMVYGVAGLIDAAILKSRVNDIKKNVKKVKKEVDKLADSAEEGEVVDKKSDKKTKKD